MTPSQLTALTDAELSWAVRERQGAICRSDIAGDTGKTRYCIVAKDDAVLSKWCNTEAEARAACPSIFDDKKTMDGLLNALPLEYAVESAHKIFNDSGDALAWMYDGNNGEWITGISRSSAFDRAVAIAWILSK